MSRCRSYHLINEGQGCVLLKANKRFCYLLGGWCAPNKCFHYFCCLWSSWSGLRHTIISQTTPRTFFGDCFILNCIAFCQVSNCMWIVDLCSAQSVIPVVCSSALRTALQLVYVLVFVHRSLTIYSRDRNAVLVSIIACLSLLIWNVWATCASSQAATSHCSIVEEKRVAKGEVPVSADWPANQGML